jgi:hypothetical protein
MLMTLNVHVLQVPQFIVCGQFAAHTRAVGKVVAAHGGVAGISMLDASQMRECGRALSAAAGCPAAGDLAMMRAIEVGGSTPRWRACMPPDSR